MVSFGRKQVGLDQLKCPECHKELGSPISDTLTTIAWGCIDCRIKIYKEE